MKQSKNKWPYPLHGEFERELRKTAAKWFADCGYAASKKYPFILDDRDNQWHKNIIVPEVAAYIKDVKKKAEDDGRPFPLHQYIHHGLSSQAMLFNLVGPFLAGVNPIEQLAQAFSGIPWPQEDLTVTLEYESRKVFNERQAQPTSIDLHVKGTTGQPLFIESKFVEHEFGGCSVFQRGDCDGRNPACDFNLCYLHNAGRTYWSRMEEYGLLQGVLRDSPLCPFINYYQFFRELLFALQEDGLFILLHDARNPTFYVESEYDSGAPRGLWPFLLSLLPEHIRSRCHRVTVQQIIRSLERSPNPPDWLAEFTRKYGLD